MRKTAVTRRVNNAAPAAKLLGSDPTIKGVLWRLDRLERQLRKLSELVRDHAEDADRLVRIVAEDRDVIRRELLRKHQETVRVRKHLREVSAKVGLDR
ncbi:MAG TPA: hypothetical protein VNK46_05485 [Nitrospiraceae bacterium]|jgi:hypothetical protein|nr:hypothetical protein [Nitrospiraceae bacterium]